MTPSATILFFGNERLASGLATTAPALRGLINSGYRVAAIVVAQNEIGKSRSQRTLEVADIATEHGIPLLSPHDLMSARDELKAYDADIAVLAAYGKIVPKAVLDIFPAGIINIHPSLLPLHRGSTPIESAILRGESETGVSLMRLSPKMDAGPVYAQHSIALDGSETKQALCTRLDQMGALMLLDALPAILDGRLKPSPQDDLQATYDQQLTKADADLDWQQPAEQLAREVRAHAVWPRSRCTIGAQTVIVTDVHVALGNGAPGALHVADGQLGIFTGGGVLVIDRLIPLGKNEMSAADFLRGYDPAA